MTQSEQFTRPALAERLREPEEPVVPSKPEPTRGREAEREVEVVRPEVPTSPPIPPPNVYRRVIIETPVDWRQWYDFYQAVVRPLVEAGVEVDANLGDLSV